MGHNCHGTTVGQHPLQTRFRIGRVKRNIGSAGLEDANYSGDQVDRTLYAQRHGNAGSYAKCLQSPCKRVGPAIELRVTEDAIFSYDCGVVRQ